MQISGSPKTVIAVSSHVVRGAVGNRAVVFALERFGHPVWALPTVTLPWHPGHGPATRVVPPAEAFDSMIDELVQSPWLGEVAAVISGYLGDARQAEGLARLISAVRARVPDATYLCDPVIGDAAGLYVPQATAEAIRDHLMPLASVATPNRHELEWLSGAPLADNAMLVDAALALGPPRVVVTSAHAMARGSTGNLLLSGRHALLAEHRLVDNPPNGLGDLFGALFLARLMAGDDDERALQLATGGVFDILARSLCGGADELMLSQHADCLLDPAAMVAMRHLVHPSRRSP